MSKLHPSLLSVSFLQVRDAHSTWIGQRLPHELSYLLPTEKVKQEIILRSRWTWIPFGTLRCKDGGGTVLRNKILPLKL